MTTDTELMRGFRYGPWHVIPERGLIRDGDTEHKIEPLVMDVFVALARHGGEVVTKDQLIDEVWDGRPQTDDVIARCISALRRGLDDDARHPQYIETVQRRGYRVMLPVSATESAAPVEPDVARQSVRPDLWMITVGLLAVIAIAWFALMRPRPGPEPVPGVTSIAVFPFECLQDARESSAHLCFGFAEEAISNLKLVDGVRIVRHRNAYGAGDEVASETLVTGSVQIIADGVRIAAQLEHAGSGEVLWSDSFDSDRDDIFNLQRQVAHALRSAIDPEFTVTITRTGPSSYAAAEAYALGRYLFEKRVHDSIPEIIGHFEDAIRIDPSFGPAWLGLAYTYSIWPDYDLTVAREATFDRALEIMAEGVDADPGIREAAGTVYGYVNLKRNQWSAAMQNTLMAVSAESPSVDDYNWHSRVLASVGRMQESLEYARLAAEMDPDYPALMSRLAIASFWVNDLDNARRYFDIANQMDLDASIHSLAYALYLIRVGDVESAKSMAIDALNELNLQTEWVGPVFDGISDDSNRPAALSILNELQASGQLPDNVIMTLSLLLDDPDRAMSVARGVDGSNSVFELELIYIDEFQAFRRHADFTAFVDEVGLSDYWQGAGCDWQDDAIVCM